MCLQELIMNVKLVLDTLKMAVYKRNIRSKLIIHTDRGSQYVSRDYKDYCNANEIELSYSRKGNPYDNACIETFYATLKKEYVYNENFKNTRELSVGIYDYIEKWYNTSRLHSKIGYISPNDYEKT